MKVVIFCGGMGVRMGEATQRIPKPMIPVGSQPILWHIMRWYASWGHNDFILCLGYRAEIVKQYFLDYSEARRERLRALEATRVELLGSDMDDWRITFLDTGVHAAIGDRLRRGASASRRRRVLPGDVRRRPHGRAARPT